MTYEERLKTLCRRCSTKETCGFIPRNLEHLCQHLSDIMYGWELGKQDTIEDACEWLESYRQDTPDGMGYIAGIVNDQTIEDFKKAMDYDKSRESRT